MRIKPGPRSGREKPSNLIERLTLIPLSAVRAHILMRRCRAIVGSWAQGRQAALLHFISVASGAPASAAALMPQGRERRGPAMEARMTLWTFSELMQMTRQELFELDQMLRAILKGLKPGTAARTTALASLENIRRVLVQRDLHL